MVLDMELSEEQRELLGTVNQCSETLLSLINDILDLSQIESDKIELENIEFNFWFNCYNSHLDFLYSKRREEN